MSEDLKEFGEKGLEVLKRVMLVGTHPSGADKKNCEDNLEELARLSDTFGLEVVGRVMCPIKKIDAGTFLGKGKIEEFIQTAKEINAQVILFDDEISPQQQRNLEGLFKKAVIDRTELIIEVFAQRAQTREARLQVDLAKIKYQFPRLKRLWTHLSRQSSSGGGAHVKGPGEKQIEMDRRQLRKRVDQLKQELELVHAQREVQRSNRLRSGIPTFAIVGYTNAGKSTLLNSMTQAGVLAEDKLFATLDTTTRKFILPNRQEVLLIDTVGFIRKIPHTLVAAFKSTLEETVHTDILLHLIDVSHPQAESQAEATYHVLKEMGALDHPIITVLNKIDACTDQGMIHRLRLKYHKTVPISALHGTGFDQLMETMMVELSNMRKKMRLRIPQSHYALVSEFMREGRMISMEYDENDILLEIELPFRLEAKAQPFQYGESA